MQQVMSNLENTIIKPPNLLMTTDIKPNTYLHTGLLSSGFVQDLPGSYQLPPPEEKHSSVDVWAITRYHEAGLISTKLGGSCSPVVPASVSEDSDG